MSVPPPVDPARNRWLLMTLARLAGSMGAVFGVVILGRAVTMEMRLLGLAITLSALYMMATVPRSLAQRWRTPPE